LRFAVVVGVLALAYATVAVAAVGDITTFTDPAGNVSGPEDITPGPDGNLWFTSFGNGRVGFITPQGAITTFTDPAGNVDLPVGITTGPQRSAVVHELEQQTDRAHHDGR
jgi:streptogramin lyase